MATKVLTEEQKQELAQAKADLIAKIMATMDTPKGYPLTADGRVDFNASPVAQPVAQDDVAMLVDWYYTFRFAGDGHGEAARKSYSCLYRPSSGSFVPQRRIAELKAQRK